MTDFALTKIFMAMLATPVSAGFALVIGTYFFVALRCINAPEASKQALAKNAPTTLTTLGILGTFIGIFLGLLEFDVFAINDSVPQLLAGLKLAFATSILGLISALAFKIVAPFLDKAAHAPSEQGAGAEEVIVAIQTLTRQMEQANERLVKTLNQNKANEKALANLPALVQELSTATKQWQSKQAEHQTALPKELGASLSATLTEQLKQLLDALTSKMADENEARFAKIHEALEASTKALTAWQDNFRDQVVAMRDSVDGVNNNIASARNDIENIGNLLATIPDRLNEMAR